MNVYFILKFLKSVLLKTLLLNFEKMILNETEKCLFIFGTNSYKIVLKGFIWFRFIVRMVLIFYFFY